MAKPVSIGPNSRTVIGSVTAANDNSLPSKKPFDWKRYIIPVGLVGVAGYIIWKGKV